MIIDVIKKRWSPYSFSSATIKDEDIKAMFEAAGMAPSSNNEQPWLFVYTNRTDSKKFNEFLDFLTLSNREWAQHAYAIIISFARLTYSYNNKPNRYALHDTGMAVANLLAQATAMNIYVHQMGGYSVAKVREHFNLRDDVEPVTVMAVGYLGDGTNISVEKLKKDEKRRPRKHQDEYSFKDILPGKFIRTL